MLYFTRNARPIFALACLAVLAGCGGGGGGGGTPKIGTLTLVSNFAAATQSEKVLLSNPLTGQQIGDTLLNASGAAQQQTVYNSLPNATLHLHIEEYDQPNGGGNLVGLIDTSINGNTASAVQTSTAGIPSTVTVTPASPTLAVGGSLQFYVAASNSAGILLFTPTGGVTWGTADPTIASSAANGIVTGVAAGTTAVQGHIGGLTGSDPITVTDPSAQPHTKWTILVFMNASNNLYPYAYQNINQMESIAGGSDVRFVVQWKQVAGVGGNTNPTFSGTRRYLITHDTTNTVKSTLIQDLGSGVDMGSAQTANDFVKWARAKFPSDHYALDLWDHGAGWRTPRVTHSILPMRGISYDDETGDNIDTWQMGLTQFNGQPGMLAGVHLDILMCDACLMQMTEVADQLQGAVDYLAGSEDNTPGPGLPYDKCFKPFFDSPTASMPTLATGFVNGYLTAYSTGPYSTTPLCMSFVDVSQIPGLVTAVDAFGAALLNNATAVKAVTPTVRTDSTGFALSDGYHYYDLYDIADRFQKANLPNQVSVAAAAVKTAVNNAVVYSAANANDPSAKGISIEFANSTTFNAYVQEYVQLNLAAQSRWDDFLASPFANP